MPRNPVCENCNGAGYFVNLCGCTTWCINCDDEALRNSEQRMLELRRQRDPENRRITSGISCFKELLGANRHGWCVEVNGPPPNYAEGLTLIALPFIAPRVAKVCNVCFGSTIEHLDCGCQVICTRCTNVNLDRIPRCHVRQYGVSYRHGLNPAIMGVIPIKGVCLNCANPYGIKQHDCGCVEWCGSCQTDKYLAQSIHATSHSTHIRRVLFPLEDLPPNDLFFTVCRRCNNAHRVMRYNCGCAEWCKNCKTAQYTLQPNQHEMECWSVSGGMRISGPMNSLVYNWPAENGPTISINWLTFI